MADTRKPCCQPAAGNLELVTTLRASSTVYSSNGRIPVQGTESCWRCKKCGARHFELVLDPGVYNAKGGQI